MSSSGISLNELKSTFAGHAGTKRKSGTTESVLSLTIDGDYFTLSPMIEIKQMVYLRVLNAL
jgi:hypothetical protein